MSSGGKYVPPKNGLPSGVRNADNGQPPEPVIMRTAVMYTSSTSGRSSRSTLNRDEVPIHYLGDLIVLETLMRHDVTPVAGGVAN